MPGCPERMHRGRAIAMTEGGCVGNGMRSGVFIGSMIGKSAFLGTPPTSLPGLGRPWWFISAWSRGWRTVINPEHCFYIPDPGPVLCSELLLTGYGLPVNRISAPALPLRAGSGGNIIFRRALTNLLKLDFSLALAGLTHNRLRPWPEHLCSLQDVFMMAPPISGSPFFRRTGE